ncbi:MAG: DEAD/DEAH box helicase [Bacilli bacterium]|nr:DEAD/DEAH box helicase [Bacilli bacterium]
MRYTFKTKPYKHQVVALQKCITQPNTALLLDPGLGKTKIAIDNLGARYLRDKLSRVLVLAPKVVLGIWEEEIELHMPHDIPRNIYRITGLKEQRLKILEEAIQNSKQEKDILHIIIMTYDSLSIRKNKQGKKLDYYYKAIQRFNPEAIIADESQLIKSNNSARSRAAHNVSKNANHRLILTGTMITKNPLDVFGQYRFLDHRIFGTVYKSFKEKFAVYGGFGNYQVIGWKNLDLLAQGVHQIAIRMRKEECLDLPEKIFVKVPVDLTERTVQIYKDMRDNMIVELEKEEFTAEIALVKSLRLQQIAGGFITRTEGEDRFTMPIGDYEKIEATTELTQLKIEEGSKVVIYVKYIWELVQLKDRLTKAGLNPLAIYGKTKDKDSDKYRNLFQNDENYKVMIMQVSKGLGITLHAANVGIFHSLSHRYDDFVQCQDRIHRIGQESDKVIYYIMLAKNSIDQHIYNSVLEKQDFSRYIQDNKYIIFND